MAYPFPNRIRTNHREIHKSSGSVECSDLTPTGGTVDFNLPPGSYTIGISVWGDANSATCTLTVAPYVDSAQSLIAGNNKFLAVGAATAAATITVPAATSTAVGGQYMLIQAGDQYGAAAPVVVVNGAQMTINCTVTTGTIHWDYVAMEW